MNQTRFRIRSGMLCGTLIFNNLTFLPVCSSAAPPVVYVPSQAYSFALSMKRYRESPASFQENPYDALGVAHNAILDYVDATLDDGGRPAKLPDSSSLFAMVSEAGANRELQLLMEKAGFKFKELSLPSPEALKKQRPAKGFYVDQREKVRVADGLNALGKIVREYLRPPSLNLSPADPFWKNLDRIRNLERQFLRERDLSETARLVLLGTCAVARHSAFYWGTGYRGRTRSSEEGLLSALGRGPSVGPGRETGTGKGWVKNFVQSTIQFFENVVRPCASPQPAYYELWGIVLSDMGGFAVGGFLGAKGGALAGPGGVIGFGIGGCVLGSVACSIEFGYKGNLDGGAFDHWYWSIWRR